MAIHQKIECIAVCCTLVLSLSTSQSLEGQDAERSAFLIPLAGVEYVDKPYEVRLGGSVAIPLFGPVDLYPSVFRYVDPVAGYDEVWQLEFNARVRLINQPRSVLPYVGAGVAWQPAWDQLSGRVPRDAFRGNTFTVLLAGIEFRQAAAVRPVVEVQLLGTGPHGAGPEGNWSYGRGEFSMLAGLAIRLN
jgi:hypothetical protein